MATMPVDLFLEWSAFRQEWSDAYDFRYKPSKPSPFTCRSKATGTEIKAYTLGQLKARVYRDYNGGTITGKAAAS